MNKILMFFLIFSIGTTIAQEQNLQGISFFSPRSQTVDAPRYNTGSYPYEHRPNRHENTFIIRATPQFSMSFKNNRIAEALWGTDTLYISGSEIPTREPYALLADYFGLSPAFQSIACLNPHISNFIFTLSTYIGFDRYLQGLYFALYAPMVWTKWDFKIDETVLSTGYQAPFPALYMDEEEVTPPYSSFTQALAGNKTYGQMSRPLSFGKVCGPQSKGGIADLLLVLGYDIVSNEHGYAGFNVRVVAPTGNRPNSTYYFEPILGNGKHWGLGAGFSGRALLWEADGTQEISFVGSVNLTHLFSTKQTRSFDLCKNGFGSRFILLKEFATDGSYTGTLTPALNITSLSCNVAISVEFEFLAMFGYTHKGIEFDLGYNGWLRSHERISLNQCIPENKYGLKGIQDAFSMFGQPSDLTQSEATLHGNLLSDQGIVVDQNSPVFIKTSDLDVSSAASELVLTHKLFFYLGYGWQEKPDDWCIPFLGLGSSIEFEGINDPCVKKPGRDTLSQWGFWINAGVTFS